ncbi:MAG: hypothetical protein WCI17_11170 [bacterium]
MAVTRFQNDILRLLAQHRRENGESYMAGGVALNVLLASARRSHDIDVFHDSETALRDSWSADRRLMLAQGYQVDVVRDGRTFVEAVIAGTAGRTVMQWACDSAYRFFPLIEDDLLGMTLHPFDLATNKVLAMAGRLEVRDWVDALNCDTCIQPLGYLVWAACGKDPGYNPQSLLAFASRAHYSQAEVDTLDFAEERPRAAVLGQHWHRALDLARSIGEVLPPGELGKCVVTRDGALFRGGADDAVQSLRDGALTFHAGRLTGSWPRIIS